jgi:ABC-type Fe3+-hydroxamate transport system substrate-binding protein
MPVFTDQLGNKIALTSSPQRIISLVPSQTELLHDLGLRDEVVGITKFCIHPNDWFRSKTRVGGTKTIDFDRIKQLQPDLIIGNKEENQKEQIEQLMQHYPVWMSDIYTLKDALDMIIRIGTLVNKQNEALLLKLQIEAAFRELNTLESTKKISVAYFIWNEPWMVACRNTFIDNMLTMCGLTNSFQHVSERYAVINEQQLIENQPDVIFLSSEPYPFKEKHILELQQLLPQAQIEIVDGELFSWYGSRLLKSPEYFKTLMA